MGKKLITRTAKIQSETRKSKGKEAVAIAYEHIPRNPEEQKHGSIYAVIEIEDTGGHAEEIAEKIIDILHDEYYEDLTREPLASFEASLAKINEDLAERSSEGQIHWLGKLNAILAVMTEQTIHVTQGGKADAYLYRAGHSMHITEDLAGDNINPLRTFINIASGDLTQDDRLVLTTPGVFYKLSKSELKRFATEGTPQNAAENISKIIVGDSGSTLPNAVLILEMASPETIAAAMEEKEISEPDVWIKEDQKTLENVTEQTVHGTVKAFDMIGKAASGAATFITSKAVPTIKEGAVKVSGKINTFKKEREAERIILDSEEKITHHHDSYPEAEIKEPNDGILESSTSSEKIEREIRIKEADHGPKRISLERFNFGGLSGAKESLTSIGKRIRLPRGKGSFFYLIIGVLLLIGLTSWAVIGASNKKQIASAESSLSQSQTKYEQATSELESGQKIQALESLTISEKLANEDLVKKYKGPESTEMLAKISALKDQVLGIIKNTATEVAFFGNENISALYSDGTILYGLNFNNGSTYRLDPATKTVTTIVEAPAIEGKIKAATLVTRRKTLVAYTEEKTIYEIDLVSKKVTKQNVSGELEDATSIASYNTNIYLLSPQNNQIYKHTKTTGGYSAKSEYLSSPESGELTNAVSLAIDSDVYVVSSDGFIKKYTSGKRQTYNPNGLPENITNPLAIFADPNVAGQYISTKANKIIKIDESQKFVAQYLSDQISDIKGVFVNDSNQTIYALSKGKVYQIKF